MTTGVDSVSSPTDVVDAAIEAYVCWREECEGTRLAYRRWSDAHQADLMLAFYAYVAALDREEIAASVYAEAMSRLADESSRLGERTLEPRREVTRGERR